MTKYCSVEYVNEKRECLVKYVLVTVEHESVIMKLDSTLCHEVYFKGDKDLAHIYWEELTESLKEFEKKISSVEYCEG